MSQAFEPREGRDAADGVSPFIPLLVMGLVLFVWFGFQAMQLRNERVALTELLAKQETQVQQSKKLRDSLDAIARGTVQLSEGGNPNARLIVDELKRRGITIANNPQQPAATDATPSVPAK